MEPLALAALLAAAVLPAAAAEPAPPADPGDGPARYARLGCAMCHGKERQGTANAPPLVPLATSWTVEALERYLRDPRGFLEREADARLRAIDGRYTRMAMPSYDRADEELRVLARWLLEARAP